MKHFFRVVFGVYITLCILGTNVEAATREYWIAAEKVVWNYAPSGKNLIRAEMGLGVWVTKSTYNTQQLLS